MTETLFRTDVVKLSKVIAGIQVPRRLARTHRGIAIWVLARQLFLAHFSTKLTPVTCLCDPGSLEHLTHVFV